MDNVTAQMPPNLTVFLVRHAEKLDGGNELAPEGFARAQRYVQYFQNQVKYDGKPIRWNICSLQRKATKAIGHF